MNYGSPIAIAFYALIAFSWLWLAWEFWHAPELDENEMPVHREPADDEFSFGVLISMDDWTPSERRRG